MSKQQQLELDAILRQGPLDLGADVATLRAVFNEVMARVPGPTISFRIPRRSAESAPSRSQSRARTPRT
jgi:hypothetical protein